MAAIVARDTSALGQLYDRHAGHVFGLCLRVLRDRMEAEEVLGDIFWEVWQRSERYSPERGAPAAYLATLARSRAIDRLRVRRKAEVVLDLESPGSLEPADAPEGTEPGPFRDAVASEQRQRIRLALADLTPDERRAVELSYFDGYSHNEIARALDAPLGTIKSRIRKGLVRLRSALVALYGSRGMA